MGKAGLHGKHNYKQKQSNPKNIAYSLPPILNININLNQ